MNEPLSEADEHELAFIQANQRLIADCEKQAKRDEIFEEAIKQIISLRNRLSALNCATEYADEFIDRAKALL